MDSRVRKVIVLMEANPRRALTLREIALTVNLSISRLRLLFKEATGMSPAQYRKLLQMQEAKALLETTFLNLKQITTKIGIKDVSHFVRDFKKDYGRTPIQHREWHHSASRQADQIAQARIGQRTSDLANK